MNQYLRIAALVTAASLRGDDIAVRLLLQTLPPEQIKAACEGCVLTMAGLLRDYLCPEAIALAINEAQAVAHQAAIEGAQP